MKNISKFMGIGVLAAAIVFAAAGCTNPIDPGENGVELSGTVSITPNTGVTVETPLTATYSGTETVTTWQWNKDGKPIPGETSATYTPTEAGSYTVTAGAEGYNPKTSAAVTVTAEPVTPDLPGNVTISPNTDVTINTPLTANYSGNETVTWQWSRDGTAIPGETSATYTPTEAGSYTVTASAEDYQSKTSAIVDVTDPSLLTLGGDITISPSTGVTVGTPLTATYSGEEEVSYHWHKDGGNVGTDSNTYTPTATGSYTVTVSAEGYNPKTSAEVIVTAEPVTPDLPGNVTISPNTGVNIGTELTANYSGSETVTWQWKKDGTDVGTNSATYTPTEAGSYTVTASAAGYQSKTSAIVDVTDPSLLTLGGDITISPSTGVTVGTPLTATYSGEEEVSYHWHKDGGNVGTNSNTYTPTAAGSYTVTVSAEGFNSKTSAEVIVTGGPPPLQTLSGNITISPASATTGTPLTANYSGSETVTWQWKKDETNVGTNSATYTPTAAGSYTVTVSAAGYNPKTSAAVDVNDPSLPTLGGTITISPSTGVTIGTLLTATYGGEEEVSYHWHKDGGNVGTNSNTYTPTAAGSYTVTVSAEGFNSKTSNIVDVTNPSLSTLGGNITVSPASAVTGTELTATYSGTETVSYQWHKDGANVGTNSNKYTPTAAGSYTVTVSAEGYNSKTSAAVTVTGGVAPPSPLPGNVTISPSAGPIEAGTLLTANYSGSETVTWQWNFDMGEEGGVFPIPSEMGGTSKTFTPPVGGIFTVTASAEGFLSKTSAPVVVMGGEGPGPGPDPNKQNPIVNWPTLTAEVGTWRSDLFDQNDNGNGTSGFFYWTDNQENVYFDAVGSQTFNLTFYPFDNLTYNVVNRDIEITVVAARAWPTVTWPGYGTLTAFHWQTLADIALPVNTGGTPGTFSWTEGGTTPVGSLGMRQHNLTFTPTDTSAYRTDARDVYINVQDQLNPNVQWPADLTAVYGQTLADITLPGNTGSTPGTFSWVDAATTSVGNVGSNFFNLTFTPTDTASYRTTQSYVSVNVIKAPGAAVPAPTVASNTLNSITLNTVAAPGNGQEVQYAMSTTNTAPESDATWQSSWNLTFSGLTYGQTYYFFARAQENSNYEAGPASHAAAITITTSANITLTIREIADGAPIIGSVTISRTGSGGNPVTSVVTVENPSQYSSISWEIAGVGANAGTPVTGTGATFTLNAADVKYNALGVHALLLTVTKDGMQYQRAIPFTIVQ